MDRLNRLAERAKRIPDSLFAVMFLDVDHFKLINDSLGHFAGDQLLIALARRLERNLRTSDTVSRVGEGTLARFGGDEFALLLDEVNFEEDVIRVGERLIGCFAEPFQIAGREIFISGSMGIALSTTGFENPADLVRDADTAMYRAKTSGRGRLEVFDSSMRDSTLARLALETDLRQGVDRKEFENWYQLIVNLRTGSIQGFEALVRWQHPTRGIVQPHDFISAAEETALILPIGRQVLKQACNDAWAWQQHRDGEPLIVSVNLSPRQFMQQDLVAQIQTDCAKAGLAATSLKLEITESMLMKDPQAVCNTLKELKTLGVRIGIDDFGTGYSSLSYLHSFPIDTLKIDRSFITGIESEPEKVEIVRTVINLAHGLALEVTAEGIETVAQLNILRNLGCDSGQGYFFSKSFNPKRR
jgi:diguanylate cyclase (GGDEF)-like protein